MPITLPDLKNTHCLSLTACGEIKTTNRALISWLKKEGRLVSDLDKPNSDFYIRVSFGGFSGKHFHLDVSSENYHSKKSISAKKAKLEIIQKKLDHLIGNGVLVDLRGYFQIEISELPE